MDIFCPKCGEPWDMDSIHEAIQEQFPGYEYECGGRGAGNWNQKAYEEKFYTPMRERFRREGCVALGGSPCSVDRTPQGRYGISPGAASAALMDLFGDDLDGVAAMLEDFGL